MAVLAHGGTAGAFAEAAFILVPIGLFAWLARVSRKRREAEEAATEAATEAEVGGDGGGEPETEGTRP